MSATPICVTVTLWSLSSNPTALKTMGKDGQKLYQESNSDKCLSWERCSGHAALSFPVIEQQFPRPFGDMSTKVRRWMGETLGTRHSEVQEELPGHERENAASGEKGNWRQPKNRSQNTELLWPKLHGVLKDRLACGGQKGKPSLEGHWAPPVTNVEKRKQWKLYPQSLQPYNKGSSRVLQPSQYSPWQLL